MAAFNDCPLVSRSAQRSPTASIRLRIVFRVNDFGVSFPCVSSSHVQGAETGAPADIVETTFWHYNDQVCRGEMDMETFNRKLTQELKADKPLNWTEYYMEAIEPIPAMHELVKWAAEHYRVGLLTNIMPGFVDIMLERGLLPNAGYEAIIDSSQVKAIKPEPEIYGAATEKAHCSPSEILLVDDSRVNLMAAEKHGWHVLWFDDYRPDESVERIKNSLQSDS